jgi:hypothetical protein
LPQLQHDIEELFVTELRRQDEQMVVEQDLMAAINERIERKQQREDEAKRRAEEATKIGEQQTGEIRPELQKRLAGIAPVPKDQAAPTAPERGGSGAGGGGALSKTAPAASGGMFSEGGENGDASSALAKTESTIVSMPMVASAKEAAQTIKFDASNLHAPIESKPEQIAAAVAQDMAWSACEEAKWQADEAEEWAESAEGYKEEMEEEEEKEAKKKAEEQRIRSTQDSEYLLKHKEEMTERDKAEQVPLCSSECSLV